LGHALLLFSSFLFLLPFAVSPRTFFHEPQFTKPCKGERKKERKKSQMFLLKKLKKNLPKSSGKAPKVEPVPGGHESPPLTTGKTDKLEASTEETAREESIGEKLQSSLANPTAEKPPPLPQEPAAHKACPKESKPLPRRYETCRVCEEKFLLTDFEKHIEVCGSSDCKGAGKGEGKLPVISDFSILAVIAQGSYGYFFFFLGWMKNETFGTALTSLLSPTPLSFCQ
jgi:hypothetical protein